MFSNFDFVFNQNEVILNMKLKRSITLGWPLTTYNMKLLNIHTHVGAAQCDFVWFSYHKTTHRTTPCGAVRLLHFEGSLGRFGCGCAV